MKETTYDLVNKYFSIQNDLDYVKSNEDDNEDTIESLNHELMVVEKKLMHKADNIEHILVKKDEAIAVTDAKIETYKKHLGMLRRHKKSLENAWDRLKDLIITNVAVSGNQNENGSITLKTPVHKYTVYETAGKLEIINQEDIPENFKEIVIKIDNKNLRKHIIDEGGETEYAKVPKIKRLKIT